MVGGAAFVWLSVLASASLLSIGGSSAVESADLQDSWTLLQKDPTEVHLLHADPRLETFLTIDTSAKAHERWPEFGDIWDTVKQSVSDITGELGDVSKVFDKDARELIYNKTMETTAVVFAKALNKALVVIDQASSKLLNLTLTEKSELLKLANESAQMLPVFENAMNRTLEKSLGNWQTVRSVVSVAGNMIGSSFNAAGQQNLALEFNNLFVAGLENMDFFVAGVMNASKDLHGLTSGLAKPILSDHLIRADRTFRTALGRVPQFATLFQQAFQGALDHTLDALPVATDRVQEEFNTVMKNVADIIWAVRSSSRELTLTCHSLLNFVAKENDIDLPEWEDPMEGAAIRPSAMGALGFFFLLFHLLSGLSGLSM